MSKAETPSKEEGSRRELSPENNDAATTSDTSTGGIVEPDTDSLIVDWDGPDDTENPVNWAASKRWINIIMISILGLITNLAPTICAPGIEGIAMDMNITSGTVQTLAITFYILGIALGPLVLSPLSEVYGRLPIYHAANLVFVAFVVGNALSNRVAQFIVFRLLSGCAGGVPMALGGGSIADLTPVPKREFAVTLFSLGPLTGPVLGPLIGGFIAASKGWRWTFWVLAIVAGAAGVASLVVLRETHPRLLLERKAASLRATTGNPRLKSRLALPLAPKQHLLQALARPVTLLVRSSKVFVLSLFVGLIYGIMYLLFTTFTGVFEGQYGFTTSTSGLVYLGLGISMVASVPIFHGINKRMMTRAATHGRPGPSPEQRLLPMLWFTPSITVGLLIYGWTAQYKTHWIAPIIGTTFIGYGAFFVIMPAQLYLVNLFGSEGAASALSANLLLRYISGTFLPLAGPKMYQSLQYGWGNTLLGFLVLAFLPLLVLLYIKGERLRDHRVAGS